MTTAMTHRALSLLLTASIVMSAGCASGRTTTNNDDRALRTYEETAKSRWTYRVALDAKQADASGAAVPDVMLSLEIAKFHRCETQFDSGVRRDAPAWYNPHAATGECDAEPVRDAKVLLFGASERVLTEVTTDASGRAVVQLPVQSILNAGPQITVEIGGERIGTSDGIAPLYRKLDNDDAEWRDAHADRCATPRDANDCAAVEAYVKDYPGGVHAAEAARIVAASATQIAALRSARDLEKAASERQEERAGIHLSNLRVRPDDPPLKRTPLQQYLVIKVDATVRRQQVASTDIWVRASCQVGPKRMVDQTAALEDLAGLNVGETKEVEFGPFVQAPLASMPSMCELLLGSEVLGRGPAIELRRYCYVPGGAFKSGPCSWPNP